MREATQRREQTRDRGQRAETRYTNKSNIYICVGGSGATVRAQALMNRENEGAMESGEWLPVSPGTLHNAGPEKCEKRGNKNRQVQTKWKRARERGRRGTHIAIAAVFCGARRGSAFGSRRHDKNSERAPAGNRHHGTPLCCVRALVCVLGCCRCNPLRRNRLPQTQNTLSPQTTHGRRRRRRF